MQKDIIWSDLCLRSITPEELRNFEELHRGDPKKVFYNFRCRDKDMISPQGSVSYEWMEDTSLPTGWKIKRGINCTYYLRWPLTSKYLNLAHYNCPAQPVKSSSLREGLLFNT